MKETCCDFCGKEKNYDELVNFGEARICDICNRAQKRLRSHGKESKGDIFKNSHLVK